jgi:hypothetical protein
MPCGELPYLVLLGQTAGFGCQSLTYYHRYYCHSSKRHVCSLRCVLPQRITQGLYAAIVLHANS